MSNNLKICVWVSLIWSIFNTILGLGIVTLFGGTITIATIAAFKDYIEYKIPTRQPDFVFGKMDFWWKEMKVLDFELSLLIYKNDNLYFQTQSNKIIKIKDLTVINAYKKYLISKALKEKLCS